MEKEVENIETAQSHYLLAKIGKRVLRPGGKELTKILIDRLNIEKKDIVVEFAPGLGFTTLMVLKKQPKTYIGVEIDEDHVKNLKQKIKSTKETEVRFITGDAERTNLQSESVDKLFGEAMLSMHANQRKSRIIKEASRILKHGGLYAIHELEMQDTPEESEKHDHIQRDLAIVSHVNARPLTFQEWQRLLADEGFEIVDIVRRPLKVLDPSRIIADEGFFHTLKIAYNVLTMPKARKRIIEMRKTFKSHDKHLTAVAIIARKN